jgi:hypothetical protein
MEDRQQPRLQLALEIDQHVTAADQVEAQEGRILHQILAGKITTSRRFLLIS